MYIKNFEKDFKKTLSDLKLLTKEDSFEIYPVDNSGEKFIVKTFSKKFQINTATQSIIELNDVKEEKINFQTKF